MNEHLFRPALLDDLEVLFECRAIGGVDLVVLVRQGAVDAMSLLAEDIHPAPLIAASEPGTRAAPRHVVEHRDILGHANGVGRRQHDPELPDADSLGLHRHVKV